MTARPLLGAPGAHTSDGAYLTGDGRRLLEERMHLLENTVLELQNALDDRERPVDTVEAYQRAAQELARVRSLLDSARSIEDVPDDPRVVELGDTVAIRLEDGVHETYIIVHGGEAPVDDRRISVESPLGRALLTRLVGDVVEVTVPAGSYKCTILSADRGEATSSR